MPKISPALSQLFDPIRDDLAKVEVEFGRHVQSHVELIPQIGRYIQQGGGKRIRPAVLLMASRLCHYTGDRAVLYASVVEFIHTATLVHDDMIDGSEWRRGRAAVHSRWGNDITVLLGDYLYIKSMALALTQDMLHVIRTLCDVTLGMIEGELYQLTKNGDVGITEDEHLAIVHRKTAYLFGGCAEIGGMLGDADAGKRDALRDYGVNLGIAFQLVDDVLDLTGRQEVVGKPVASDLREGAVTLPIIRLLQVAKPEERLADLVGDIVREQAVTPQQWDRLSAALRDSGSLDYAMCVAEGYAEKARTALQLFPPSPERDALLALPDYVISRDR